MQRIKSNSKINKNILIIDSTLRDGSHAVRHSFSKDQIEKYARISENAGIEILVVGHGNGLGASSLHLGISKLSDKEMLSIAKIQLKNTQLGAFIIPGFGTIKNDLNPAIKSGIQVLMVASHCTEANITRQHIEYGVSKGLRVYGVLMMSHTIKASELLEQAKLMQEYGASGVLLMDSAGSYLMSDVKEKVSALVEGLTIDVGFHAHNNLGLAVANSIVAVTSGATILDTTSFGIGAGAGNSPMEVVVADLKKMGYRLKPDLYHLMDNAEYVRQNLMVKPLEINALTLTSGLAGVFSGFAPHVEKAALNFKVDIRDLLMELGKEGVVAGQEDIIIHLAERLSKRGKNKQ